MRQAKDQGWTSPSWRVLLVTVLMLGLAAPAQAGYREQAKRLHDRLAGVPPSDLVLQQMEDAINPALPGDAIDAAYIAMDDVNFYNVTLKNFAAPWTNRDRSVFVPLNDYIATVIGMVRDNVPFNTLLSADLTYVGSSGPAPSRDNNDHYEQLEKDNVDLSLRANLDAVPQSSIQQIPSPATAGVITSRAASEAFFIAGTNRAMFRFTLLNHMCNDMEQMHDPKLPPDRIRQDVSRSPGGDSRLFLNNCVGCHTGMDPMAQAFAYYNYVDNGDGTGRLEYSGNGPGLGGTVQPKYFNNDLNFPQGFRTPDDSWDNYWRSGQNSYLGFSPGLPGSGSGAKSLGEELANSEAFAACQVRKVFKNVCLRDPEDINDRGMVNQLTTDFMTTLGYRMKDVFAETAVYCMGQ
ncbi:MAG: hypothetical protein OEM25_02700 [Gammaproteobacteria bacterium]|nr:hypothetical protein [Gammaproteobacteria bacterium]